MFLTNTLIVLDDDLSELRESGGKHAKLLSDMCKFYRDWHVKSDGVYGNYCILHGQVHNALFILLYVFNIMICLHGILPLISSTDLNALPNSGIFLHDPVSFIALVRPDLFKYKKGVVRVETQGICIGHTLMDQGLKKYVLSS